MRVEVSLRPRSEVGYDKQYHRQVRGLLWSGLGLVDDYTERHDRPHPPGLTFSPIQPWDRTLSPESTYTLTIGGHDPDLVRAAASELVAAGEVDIGAMPFTVLSGSTERVDVGPPGTEGVIESLSGLHLAFPDEVCRQYGIEPFDGAGETYWEPDHGTRIVHRAIEKSLQFRWEIAKRDLLPASDGGATTATSPSADAREIATGWGLDDGTPGPDEVNAPLFSDEELLKTYWLHLDRPDQNHTQRVNLSKWRFKYRVRDQTHRRHLNFGLTAGFGRKTGEGLGFCTVAERRTPTLGGGGGV